MPLDVTTAEPDEPDPVAAVTQAFYDIGRLDPAPRSRRPEVQEATTQERAAWEYYVSTVLMTLADARRDKAKKAAIAAAVLPNYVAHPLPVGTVTTVWAGGLLSIGVKVTPQADRVDVPGLIATLAAGGVKPTLLKRALKAHTREFPGAHIFTPRLNED